MGRLVAQQLTKSLGQNFIIDNRPGAANIIATEIVAKAPPDGYTLLIGTSSTFVTNPLIYAKLPYSEKDFEAISIISHAPLIAIQQQIADLGAEVIGTPRRKSARKSCASARSGEGS